MMTTLYSALARLLLVSVLGLTAMTAAAAPPPGLDKPVTLAAREQPVGRFLEELLGRLDLPVRVDSSVRGTVNGDFKASAGKILDDIAGSFQLTVYYDGAIVWIYPASATIRDLVYVSGQGGGKVLDSARKLGLIDASNRVTVSNVGVVATGTERFVEQIREIADAVQRGAKTDAPADVMRVFKLKYAWAGDVQLNAGGQEVLVPGVASLLSRLIEPGAMGVAGPTRVQLPHTREGLRGKGLTSVGSRSVQGDEAAPTTTSPLPPASGSTRDTRIVADTLNNAVVIRDRADRMASYESLIASLDVEPEMIELEATIIDLNTDRLRELGINWRLDEQDGGALFGGNGIGANELRPDSPLTSGGPGGIVSLVLGDENQFISRIRALEGQGAARVVSKPHVMTLSNVEALLDTTSTFFVRVAGEEEVDLFDVSVGTTLRVMPHVFEGNNGARIKLRVNIEDGSQTGQRVDAIPIIERSTINTQALVDEGESLLIGGLVREFDTNTVSKVPGLGSIPVLGSLFRNSTKSTRRVERMFLITPRINLREGQGRRYSAPILSGTEAEILESGPARIESALAGMASRDDAFPIKRELPGTHRGNVGLTAPGQPRPEDPSQQVRTWDDTRPSLRQRLLAQPRRSEPSQEIAVPAPQSVDDSGWQVVGGRDAMAVGSDDDWQSVGASGNAALPTDDQGWQEVTR